MVVFLEETVCVQKLVTEDEEIAVWHSRQNTGRCKSTEGCA